LHIVPRIWYLRFTTRGKKGPLTTTGDLSACNSKRTLIQLLTVNRAQPWTLRKTNKVMGYNRLPLKSESWCSHHLVWVDCEFLERLVYSFSPTFKDTNKKASMYAITKIRVSQKDRWIPLGFELPIPGNSTRKGGLLMVLNCAQVHRKPTGDLVRFSPRRILPRFVNPKIGSKPQRFSI
jgi:hypothetical protein